MEESILDNSATLAKHADSLPPGEALLARLHANRVWRLSQDVVHTRIEAALEAAREPSERGKQRSGVVDEPDDNELVEPSVPARRQRKRSLAKVCEAARKAGADRVIVDGVVIALSPAAAVPEPTANEWDTVLPLGDHGPH